MAASCFTYKYLCLSLDSEITADGSLLLHLLIPLSLPFSLAGYGGGMSSAKAALESDTRLLAFEAGRKYGVRVNTISAGPLGSRAAKAIGFIDDMIRCAQRPLASAKPKLNP